MNINIYNRAETIRDQVRRLQDLKARLLYSNFYIGTDGARNIKRDDILIDIREDILSATTDAIDKNIKLLEEEFERL